MPPWCVRRGASAIALVSRRRGTAVVRASAGWRTRRASGSCRCQAGRRTRGSRGRLAAAQHQGAQLDDALEHGSDLGLVRLDLAPRADHAREGPVTDAQLALRRPG